MAVPPAPVQVPGQKSFALSDTSVRSVANQIIQGAVQRSPGIRPMAEEIGKPQLGDRMMKGP